MTSSRQSRVLLVVPGRSERDGSKVAGLRRETDHEVVVRRPATAAEFLRELGPTIDCVVCCADGEADVPALVEADTSIPLIVHGDDPPAAPVDGVVARDGGASALARQVRDRVERERERDRLSETNAKLTALAGFASEITACETAEEVYERTAEVVTEALAYRKYVLGLVGPDGLLYPWSTTGDSPPLAPDEGIAGRTYRTGEPQIVGDVREDPDARTDPDAPLTCLSVPVGDHGVIQVGRGRAHDYDERDVEFLQTVASQAAEALSRIRREVDLRVERDRLHAFFGGLAAPAVYVEAADGEEPVLKEVNPAYERAFGGDHVLDPVSEAFPTATERTLFADPPESGESVRREITRRTVDGEQSLVVGVVPVPTAGLDAAAFGLYVGDTGFV